MSNFEYNSALDKFLVKKHNKVKPKMDDTILNKMIAIYLQNNNNIRNICKEDHTFIVQALNTLHYFQQISEKVGPSGMSKLAESIKVVKFPANKLIFKYGDEGKAFYVIIQGDLNVYIPSSSRKTNSGDYINQELIEINQLGKGQAFGELALMKRQPRAAAVKCMTDCILAELDYYHYSVLLHDLENEKMNKFTSLLKNFDLFHQIRKTSLERFFSIVEYKSFRKNQVIFAEGDPVDGIYFIKSGEFLITKKAPNLTHPNQLKELESEIKDLEKEGKIYQKCLFGKYNINSEIIQKLRKEILPNHRLSKPVEKVIFSKGERKSYELVVLRENEIFGDIELVTKLQKRVLTVSCKSEHGEVCYFNKDKFSKICVGSLFSALSTHVNNKCKLYNSRYHQANEIHKSKLSTDQLNSFEEKGTLIEIQRERSQKLLHIEKKNAVKMHNFQIKQLINKKGINAEDKKTLMEDIRIMKSRNQKYGDHLLKLNIETPLNTNNTQAHVIKTKRMIDDRFISKLNRNRNSTTENSYWNNNNCTNTISYVTTETDVGKFSEKLSVKKKSLISPGVVMRERSSIKDKQSHGNTKLNDEDSYFSIVEPKADFKSSREVIAYHIKSANVKKFLLRGSAQNFKNFQK